MKTLKETNLEELNLTELDENSLNSIKGGPTEGQHDHIGNFNFKVEIEGTEEKKEEEKKEKK